MLCHIVVGILEFWYQLMFAWLKRSFGLIYTNKLIANILLMDLNLYSILIILTNLKS